MNGLKKCQEGKVILVGFRVAYLSMHYCLVSHECLFKCGSSAAQLARKSPFSTGHSSVHSPPVGSQVGPAVQPSTSVDASTVGVGQGEPQTGGGARDSIKMTVSALYCNEQIGVGIACRHIRRGRTPGAPRDPAKIRRARCCPAQHCAVVIRRRGSERPIHAHGDGREGAAARDGQCLR